MASAAAIALLVLVGDVFAAKEEAVAVAARPSVRDLTVRSFDRAILGSRYTLVEFYSSACQHCAELAPKYEAAARVLEQRNIAVARLDGTAAKDLLYKYEVKAFPTILWFEDDPDITFWPNSDLTDTDSIVEWALSMATPVVREAVELPEPGALPSITLRAETLLKNFESVARANRRSASWHHITEAGTPELCIHHRGEDPVTLRGEPLEQKMAVREFFRSNRYPMVGRVEDDNLHEYMEADQGVIRILFPEEGTKGSTALESKESMMEIAKALRGQYLVTYREVDKHSPDVKQLAGSKSKLPLAIIFPKPTDKKWFVYRGKIEAHPMSKFLQQVEAGAITAASRSAPVPAAHSGAVKVVVGATLKLECFSDTKDVLLEIYAPWCEHCKALQPEYEKLAQKVKDLDLEKYLVIANMDGTQNDSPVNGVEADGYPTIYLFKAGIDKPLIYSGEGKKAQDLWKFILDEGSNMYEIQDQMTERNHRMEL